MKIRPPTVRAFLGDDEIVVDLFAGGGGASTGIHRATGRSPDVAINHSPEAIALHAANHPTARHYIANVYDVDPRRAAAGRPVALLWLSPDCTHHSKAKGGKPRDQGLRSLADVAIPWAEQVRPRVIMLENVEEWSHWGPLDDAGRPIKERRGEFFRAWVAKLEALGYVVEWRLLRACDYGAPTTRRRLFLIARCDGRPIAWPEPTHGPAAGLEPHRAAAEVIDWSIPCQSIFDRRKPHVRATRARVARGVQKFVLESSRPFFVHLAHDALAVPYLVHRSNGERPGQAPRVYDIGAPHPTVVAQGIKTSLVVACVAKHYSERRAGEAMGQQLNLPLGTVTTRDHHALIVANMVKLRGTSDAHIAASAGEMHAPVPTISAGGTHHAVVASFLSRYNGQSVGQQPSIPIGTLDTRDRYGLVEAAAAEWTPEIERRAQRVYAFMVEHGHDGPGFDHERKLVTLQVGEHRLVIYDLAMRMLVARELFRAQGFPDDYVIDPIGPNGKPLSKTAQVRACGNAVPPDFVDALVTSTFAEAA